MTQSYLRISIVNVNQSNKSYTVSDAPSSKYRYKSQLYILILSSYQKRYTNAETIHSLPLNFSRSKGLNVNDIQKQWFAEGTPEKDCLQYMAHGRQ